MRVRVVSLYIYPVKSLRGVALDRAVLEPAGLAGDRQWLVVRADGRFQTQRDHPRMALIRASGGADALELSLPGHGGVWVSAGVDSGRRIATEVWGDPCETIDAGDEAAAWLTAVLQSRSELRLVRMADGYLRPQRHPDRFGAATSTVFADTAPFLVANKASLERLNEALREQGKDAVPMDRFRPNVVIDGLAAFAEHGVGTLAGDGYALQLRYPRERCVVTTIDQSTAVRDPQGEPFRTLTAINPMPGQPRAPAFAELAVLATGGGRTIRVGDELQAGGSRT